MEHKKERDADGEAFMKSLMMKKCHPDKSTQTTT